MFVALFFVLLGLIQKFNSIINYFNNQTILSPNHSPTPKSHPQHDNPTFPNQYIRSIILAPHKPHLPPFILHLTNCTRPPLNRLKSTHTSPQAYITILMLSIHTILYQCILIHVTCISIHTYDIHLYFFCASVIAIFKYLTYYLV